MAEANIVFLIDVNGIQRDPPVEYDPKDGSSTRKNDSNDVSTEIFPSSEDGGTEKATTRISDQQLEWLKDFVLTTLYREANKGDNDEYDFGKVQWCFKFFDSSRHTDYKECRGFLPFDNESFTNFEKQLQQRIKTADDAKTIVSMSHYDIPPIKYLTDTIKIITGSLPWYESQQNHTQSFNLSRSFNVEEPTLIGRNMVYAFFRVPRTEKELFEFTDLKTNASSKDFMKVLLPEAFSNKFHFKFKIQLNFVDLWTAPENTGVCYEPSWSGEYPRQIIRCLHYLSSGKVIPIPIKEYSSMKYSAATFGLKPYIQYLRYRLKQISQQNENLPSSIQQLADKTSKGHQKISPSLDASSLLSRSLRSSTSHLDPPLNIHSKILRPFGIRPHESDSIDLDAHLSYHRQSLANIKAKDQARERKRKRLEFDYDPDEYHSSSQSRRSFYDNPAYDYETDSVCEREDRLEKWVNDGIFTTAKRNKHTDIGSSAAVPMSRPAKAFHTFQEPAPKLLSSRGKKMLATVERQKLKEHSVSNHKRRSSEGIDRTRMLQKHEEELGALKHRLKIYLAGEVKSVEDPISWLIKFQSSLRGFVDMILGEENPSLVPLAQALVNFASRSFHETFLANVRKKSKRPDLTAKDLLAEVLLTEFASLNLKIIKAHEHPKDRQSAKELNMLKKMAFREAELQIILRVEIAWCYVAPNEDSTEELLAEIVRLLQIIAAYRTQVPVEKFIESVLLPSYINGTRFMRELYKRMNIPVPFELTIAGSPVPGTSKRDDNSSVLSSSASSNLCPEDSASQLDLHKSKRYRSRPSFTVSKKSTIPNPKYPDRKCNSGSKSKRVKRQILLSTSNPSLSHSQFPSERTNSQKKNGGGNNKVSPKRVRRNLFDVQKKDKKDSKTLIALSSKLPKSPVFKSPKTKTKSPSGFFRAARSRKQFTMNNHHVEPQFGSPIADSHVLCPESPVTPGDRMSLSSKHTSSTPGNTGMSGVVQESPEVHKMDYNNRPMIRVASLSFYSTGNDASKARAWEKSQSKLMAEKIKESIDLRNKHSSAEKNPDHLSSPNIKSDVHEMDTSKDTTATSESHLSIYADSALQDQQIEKSQLECEPSLQTSIISPYRPPSSSIRSPISTYTGPAPDLTNPEIHSLITSAKFPPTPFLSKDKVTNSNVCDVQAMPVSTSPSNLQTPSKRVQFNLNENLVNTPASSRKSNCVTPKSILKETHDTHVE